MKNEKIKIENEKRTSARGTEMFIHFFFTITHKRRQKTVGQINLWKKNKQTNGSTLGKKKEKTSIKYNPVISEGLQQRSMRGFFLIYAH